MDKADYGGRPHLGNQNSMAITAAAASKASLFLNLAIKIPFQKSFS
jgi:hypothetical protein